MSVKNNGFPVQDVFLNYAILPALYMAKLRKVCCCKTAISNRALLLFIRQSSQFNRQILSQNIHSQIHMTRNMH